MAVKVVTDSIADLPPEVARDLGGSIISSQVEGLEKTLKVGFWMLQCRGTDTPGQGYYYYWPRWR